MSTDPRLRLAMLTAKYAETPELKTAAIKEALGRLKQRVLGVIKVLGAGGKSLWRLAKLYVMKKWLLTRIRIREVRSTTWFALAFFNLVAVVFLFALAGILVIAGYSAMVDPEGWKQVMDLALSKVDDMMRGLGMMGDAEKQGIWAAISSQGVGPLIKMMTTALSFLMGAAGLLSAVGLYALGREVKAKLKKMISLLRSRKLSGKGFLDSLGDALESDVAKLREDVKAPPSYLQPHRL